MHKLSKKSNKGFSILAIILVIVAVIIAIGIWALSGQSNINNSSNGKSDILSSSLINEGNNFRITYNSYLLKGINPYNLNYVPNSNIDNNFYSIQGMQFPIVNKNLLRNDVVLGNNGEGFWIADLKYTLNNLPGTPARQTFILAGVTDNVCKKINQNINNTVEIPYFTNRVGNLSDELKAVLISNATTNRIAAVNSAANASFSDWRSGCVSYNNTLPDYNMYFIVM